MINERTILLNKVKCKKKQNALMSIVFLIPQRYVLAIMANFAIVNAYTMRVILSIAIVRMVKPHDSGGEGEVPSGECPVKPGNSTSNIGGEFEWDEQMQGLILSAFFWGYIITHLPGGIIAERFGGKHVLGLGVLCTSIFTVLTPAVVEYGGATALLILRVIEGLGEGTTYPAVNVLLARWSPEHERGKLGSIVFAGSQIGTVFGTLVSGELLSYYSWHSVFYVFGSISICWWLLWNLLCYNDPNSHPFLGDEEREYLEKHVGGTRDKDLPKPPLKAIFTSVPLFALVCAQIGHDWGFFTMVTDLPKYMNDVLRFDIGANGLVSSIPYIFMWIVSILSGILCDFMISRNMVSITVARKLFTSIAATGPAIFIVAASYAGCDKTSVVILFSIAMGLMGAFYPGMKVNALDLAPNYAGFLMAIVNGIGAITGVIAPIIIGLLTTSRNLYEWRTVFWISFGIFVVTNIIFVLFGSGERQEWDDRRKIMVVPAESGKIELTDQKPQIAKEITT